MSLRLRIVSDLHFEFHRDKGKEFTGKVAAGGFDVLVVAGDLTDYNHMYDSVKMLAAAVAPRPMVYVLGNHEFYGGTANSLEGEVALLRNECPNLCLLERNVVEIQGQRIIGCTLWYPYPHGAGPARWNDFTWTPDLHLWLPKTASVSASWLKETVQPGDIVVTHFLPHPRSILPKWRGDSSNRFFLHDVSGVVEGGGAKLWIHGHTHGSVDFTVNQTRVVCNPLGYVRNAMDEPNVKFDPKLTVTI